MFEFIFRYYYIYNSIIYIYELLIKYYYNYDLNNMYIEGPDAANPLVRPYYRAAHYNKIFIQYRTQ